MSISPQAGQPGGRQQTQQRRVDEPREGGFHVGITWGSREESRRTRGGGKAGGFAQRRPQAGARDPRAASVRRRGDLRVRLDRALASSRAASRRSGGGDL